MVRGSNAYTLTMGNLLSMELATSQEKCRYIQFRHYPFNYYVIMNKIWKVCTLAIPIFSAVARSQASYWRSAHFLQ